LEYSYANTDLLEFPQKYQMTPFEGREFLSSYEKNRQKILDKIKNNQTVNSLSHTLELLQKQFLIDIKSDQKIFVTSNQLSSILLRLQHQKETQQETKFIMALLKKFEIKKRIFSEYDHELKENSTDFKILTNYILLAAICAKKFQKPNHKYLDDVFDPYIRAETLIELLKNKTMPFTESIKQNPLDGETYHIIHPVLKHIAILRCITND